MSHEVSRSRVGHPGARLTAPLALVTGLAAGTLLGACSAIVQTDPDRFGEHTERDVGTPSGEDGGGVVERDAYVPPGVDVGVVLPDAAVVCDGDCDDGVECTEDVCDDGVCVHLLRHARCEQLCSATGCVARHCDGDEDCTDGDACNGIERCEAGAPGSGCVSSGEILNCDDGVPCTADGCSATTGCVHARNDGLCEDGIDCTFDTCSMQGCVHEPQPARCAATCMQNAICDPNVGCVGGQPRVCQPDSDPCTTEGCDMTNGECFTLPLDADGDGVPAAMVGGSVCAGGTDCNDSNPTVFPGADEVCDTVDQNCNGQIDEGCMLPDRCDSALELTLAGSGSRREASFVGSFDRLSNDYDTDCDSNENEGGNDGVFFITLDGGITGNSYDVFVETITDETRTADTVLAVALDCGSNGFQRQCNDDGNSSSTGDRGRVASRIWLHNLSVSGLQSRRLHILVDGFDQRARGEFQLHVVVTPVASDSCDGPLDISAGGLVLGQRAGFTSSVRPSCTGFGDVEAVLRFNADGNVDRLDASSGQDASYALRSNCRSGPDSFCVNQRSVSQTNFSAMGQQFLIIDSLGFDQVYRVVYDP